MSAALISTAQDLCIQVRRLYPYSQSIKNLLREVGRWRPEINGRESCEIIVDVTYDTGENVAENVAENDERDVDMISETMSADSTSRVISTCPVTFRGIRSAPGSVHIAHLCDALRAWKFSIVRGAPHGCDNSRFAEE